MLQQHAISHAQTLSCGLRTTLSERWCLRGSGKYLMLIREHVSPSHIEQKAKKERTCDLSRLSKRWPAYDVAVLMEQHSSRINGHFDVTHVRLHKHLITFS
jgi:hypothetical protein